MEDKIKKIWMTVGISTAAIFVGIAILGSVLICNYNRDEEVLVGVEVTEGVKVDTTLEDKTFEKLVKLSPEKLFTENFSDSFLNERGYYRVTATVYNPVVSQCDDDPLVTADMSKIDLDKLNQGKLKWVSLSRNLLEYFKYGDKILVISNDTAIGGVYEVHDTMDKRFKDYIDLLQPINKRTGKWKDVIIRKIED